MTNDGTNAYTWNEFSKMKSVNLSGAGCTSAGECLVYDAFGRVVEVNTGSTHTEIWFTQLGKTAYMNGSTKKYLYLPAPGRATFLDDGSTSGLWMHKDWLGNARLLSSISAGTIKSDRAFAPYGEIYDIFGATTQDEAMFTGDTQDVIAGMYDTTNRELQGSQQGRWLSPDPAGAGWNQYAYATNPNSGIDPSGLVTIPPYWYLAFDEGAGGFESLSYTDEVSGIPLGSGTAAADGGSSAIPSTSSSSASSGSSLGSSSAGTLNMDFGAGAAMLLALFQSADGSPEGTPESENLEPLNPLEETNWEQATEQLTQGELVWPTTGWQYNLLNPGPLPAAIAQYFAGGQYSVMTVGDEGWSFDALYRVYGGASAENGPWYTPVPQAGGLQSQIDLNLRPEWGNTAEDVVCVYLQPGTTVYVGPAAAQTGQSLQGYGAGGPQSLGISGTPQIYVPKP